jgi:Zn-dependent M28 family amino/carboxypeptidase
VLRRVTSCFGSLLLLACAAAAPRWEGPLEPAPAVDGALWRSEAGWLADPAREGRGLGTEGLAAAGARLAERFREAGLEPGAPGGGFFQAFRMPVAIEVAEARLTVDGEALVRDRDYRVLLGSADGRFSGPLVFAGYGVRDEASGWDDWAGLDAKDAVVLVLEGRPEHPAFADRRGAALGRRGAKLLAARERGARAVLFAPGPGPADEALVEDAAGALPTRTSAGVVTLALSRASAASALRGAGLDLETLVRAAERRFRPPLQRVRAAGAVRIARREGEAANVIARLPGADPARAHEQVVIGAHYDHLGHGEFGSMRPAAAGQIHPGADDNASGAAALVALARAFAAGPRPARTLVFAAFSAEEAGLIGSAKYVEALGPGAVAAMVNLDMIGRLSENGVTVFGGETAAGFRELVRWSAERRGLPIAFEDGAHGPSDHASFLAAEIPALFFTTGAHEAYHTPDDRAEGLRTEETVRVLGLVADVTLALANASRAPAFAGAASPRRAPPAGEGGYGPYLGTVPAFGAAGVGGAKIAAVRAGSPAERAGLRAGDVIVEFAGSTVTSLEDFASLLLSQREGTSVRIVVQRGGERVETEAVLGRRP